MSRSGRSTPPSGVRAGKLMGAARVGSELAVDAFVVAVGNLAGGAVVATADPKDLIRLSAHAVAVTIASIIPVDPSA